MDEYKKLIIFTGVILGIGVAIGVAIGRLIGRNDEVGR